LRFYESPSLVKRESPVFRSVVVPFFYPSIGFRLAQVGCFERVRVAPSLDERQAQRKPEHALTARDDGSVLSSLF